MSEQKKLNMLVFRPEDLSVAETQTLLTGGVAPRPIALVSTLSSQGVRNLAPFSFFNAFGSNPPYVAFSPARKGKDGELKDTYRNLMETGECVINAVTVHMVEQVNITSAEYGSEVDEFAKGGLSPIPSQRVKPPRVKESPFHMECVLDQMIGLGEGRGSGNLALCKVVLFHVSDHVWKDGTFDARKVEHVGRNGGAFYSRSQGEALFELPMPRGRLGMGFDQLPPRIRESKLLTGNQLARLALHQNSPSSDEIREFLARIPVQEGTSEDFAREETRGEWARLMGLARFLEGKTQDFSWRERAIRCALAQGREKEALCLSFLP